MVDVFLKIVNMSISASWLVLAVLVFRFVFKKAPKWIHVLLWGIVAVRLLCPFSIESALSLIPSAETISPEIMMSREPTIHTGVPAINSVVNPIITETFAPEPVASANPLQILIPVLAMIWGIGVALLLAYTAISYWRLRRRVRMAVLLRDNIYQSEAVSSPFVLGIIKPKIYLPFQIDGQNLEHVVSHEQAHIRRRDHWWKPLGFLLLTIHWFNPIMWLAYVLLCRDIELACDEKVVKELGMEQRADYSHALLACSVNRRMIAACPLAFGEVGVKERVKTVLNYKKPAFWVIVVSLIACAVVAVCFLTNPIDAIEGYYHVEGYGIYNDSEYYVVVNDGVELKCTKWYVKACLHYGWSKQKLSAKIADSAHENTVLDTETQVWYTELNSHSIAERELCEGAADPVRAHLTNTYVSRRLLHSVGRVKQIQRLLWQRLKLMEVGITCCCWLPGQCYIPMLRRCLPADVARC